MKTLPVMTRIDPETKRKLQALAKATDRSEAYLAREAIEAFVGLNEWQVAEIAASLDDVRAGGTTIPHDDVEAWVRSWGTESERPRPKRQA